MRLTSLLLPAASLIATASARVNGFMVPSHVSPGQNVDVIITTEGYIQTVYDIAISFGLSTAALSYPTTLGGTYLNAKFLGRPLSGVQTNISHTVTIPSDTKPGPYVINSVGLSLAGNSLAAGVEYYSANVTVGDSPSSELVAANFVPSGC